MHLFLETMRGKDLVILFYNDIDNDITNISEL